MYNRRVRPYDYQQPYMAPRPASMGYQPQGSISQSQNDREQQQGMPNIPTGLLKEILKPAPYSLGSELPTSAGLMDNYIAGMGLGPSSPYALGSASDLSFSTPYLDSIAPNLGFGEAATSLMPAADSGAFSLGAAGTAEGVGAAGAAGTAGAEAAGTSAAGSAGMMGPWAPITLAAMLAKSQVQGSDPSSPAGLLDTALLPSIDQWLANPARSAGNTLDPIGTMIGDVGGVGDEPWYSFLSPAGIFGSIF